MKHRTPSEIDRIARGVRSGMVEHYQEKIFAVLSDVTRLKHYLMSGIPLNGQKRVIEDALKEGRGVIIATGHYGAVEFLPPYLAIKGYPTTALVKFTTKSLEEIAVRQATELGLGLIIPCHVRNILHEAAKVLSQNKILLTQCDEIDEWRPDPNRTMEFLGKKTHPDRMLKVLCKKTGAVLLLGLLERDGKGKYNLVLHRVPEEGEIPSNVRTLKLLETYIYRHPEQWYEWKKYDHIACVN
jgi:lauroyl/myristoyl acyltransferase